MLKMYWIFKNNWKRVEVGAGQTKRKNQEAVVDKKSPRTIIVNETIKIIYISLKHRLIFYCLLENLLLK